MKKFKVGLQLYGIREEMEKDMDAALKKVKEIGYDYVEFAGYFGKTADEVKAILDKHNLKAISVHQGPTLFLEEGQKAIDYIKDIGAKYSAIPWYTVDEFIDNWDATIEMFTQLGNDLKASGIRLLYHNHDFEFGTVDGVPILDKLYEAIPSDILQPELDVCWVRYAGNDPAEYIRKYSGRTDVVHIKDFVCDKLGGAPVYGLIDDDGSNNTSNTREDNGFKFRPVGYGMQNWKSILEAAEDADAEYLIVEQDQWYDDDPIECARKSREYLRDNFGF